MSDGNRYEQWHKEYDEYLQKNQGKNVGQNVSDMLDSWIKDYNSYVSDYQKRFSGRKGTYEDAYVNDSADWLKSATEKKTALDQGAKEILAYLNRYGGHLDANIAKQNPDATIIIPPTSHAKIDIFKSPPDKARTPPAFKKTPEPITIPITMAIPVHKPYCFFTSFIRIYPFYDIIKKAITFFKNNIIYKKITYFI